MVSSTPDHAQAFDLPQHNDGKDHDGVNKSSVVEDYATPGDSSPSRFLYLLITVLAIGGFLFGYDTGVIAGALLPIKEEFGLSTQQQEFVVGGTEPMLPVPVPPVLLRYYSHYSPSVIPTHTRLALVVLLILQNFVCLSWTVIERQRGRERERVAPALPLSLTSLRHCRLSTLFCLSSLITLAQLYGNIGTTLGAILGGLLAGALSDLVGRKPVTLLSSIVFIVGAALMTFAHHYWLLLLGRVVVGVGVGLAALVVPLYIGGMEEPS